jgi:hydroxyacylglutathione hydrolase
VEPEKTLAAAKHENATITHALTTHHHGDHAGGNEKIAGAVKGIEVVGGDDRIPAMNKKVYSCQCPHFLQYAYAITG